MVISTNKFDSNAIQTALKLEDGGYSVVGDDKSESSLRPNKLSEIIGRKKEKTILSKIISSAKKRGKALDHILLHGPPGLGKTSIAYVIAKEFNGSKITVVNGNSIEKPSDLTSVLASLSENDILFIDEIHRLRSSVEEVLYPAMEDRYVDIIVGKGPSARVVKIDLEPFTLIGATTLLSKISNPLRDRFGVILKLDYYNENEIAEILAQKSKLMGLNIDTESLDILSKHSRMTPRIAIRLLKTVRDFVIANSVEIFQEIKISKNVVNEVLSTLEIFQYGLDNLDVDILKVLYRAYPNAVGLKTLSSTVGEDLNTIESVYEPYLLKLGLIVKTHKGRMIMEDGINFINKLNYI
jgi:Holliday junction DNA helicase RuvB